VNRYYTWGLDLSGLGGNSGGRLGVSPGGLHGAGGIGGLLAVQDVTRTPLEREPVEPIPVGSTLLVGGSDGQVAALDLDGVEAGGDGSAVLHYAGESGENATMGLEDSSLATSAGALAYTASDGSQTVLGLAGVEEYAGQEYLVFGDESGTVGISLITSGGGGGGGGGGGMTNWRTTTRKYLYFYDANGNVGQVMDWSSGELVAKYEYDPYGRTLVAAGDYASANPFRFSTKYWDDESGLGYWGYRYYTPRLGRWISRDPMGEAGGWNLYSFVTNNPAGKTDSLGLECYCGPDMTDFLKNLMNSAIAWRTSQGWRPFGGFRWLLRHRMQLDWTAGKYNTANCPSQGECSSTYWLCGECVHDHWIGNFMYGFLGRLLGQPDWRTDFAGQFVQQPSGTDDPPWDTAGYDIARGLFEEMQKRPMNVGQMCEQFKKDKTLWKTANDTSAVPPEGRRYPSPHASGYSNCKKCPESLSAGAGGTFPGGGLGNAWPPIPFP